MGVPKFYRWISERYPCLSDVVREYQIPDFDNLYLDMNGIIHVCSHPNDDDPHFRITEEKIFEAICHYIECLFKMVRPKKVFFMAVDGVAPRAKMNQQRGRRFRSAREAEESEKRAVSRGEVLPTEERFDSNCITPGTEFMVKLQEHLKYFVTAKISTDKSWQGLRVYLSGHETPGEGEHKIMDFIRSEKSKPGYDSHTRHCLYGLDADLIMLGLCSHEPHFSLLREEINFSRKKASQRIQTPEEITFHLLHLSLLREYIDYEFSSLKDKLTFPYDIENIIDDWVLMGFLVGNDFIPHLPHMHIAHDALPSLYQVYISVLPTLDGYINEGGFLNLVRFEKYLQAVSKNDYEQFRDTLADIKWLRSKSGESRADAVKRVKIALEDCAKAEISASEQDSLLEENDEHNACNLIDLDDIPLPDAERYENECTMSDYDEREDREIFEMELVQHKREYYTQKLAYEQFTPEVLREQAECYVLAIQWILHYYYNGVCSWSWYYPHHYAPYVSDVKDFRGMSLNFEMGTPFLPFEQLLAVLPSASKQFLPEPYQSLMCDANSPLIHYYPTNFETDLNGKQQSWEAIVLIPFIDEKRLLDAMKPIFEKVSKHEQERNVHKPCLLYTYSAENVGKFAGSVLGNLPCIEINHAKCEILLLESFQVERSKLRKGLCEGFNKDWYIPGFPTLKHVPHKSCLKKAGVKVFQMPSRNNSIILELEPQLSTFNDEELSAIAGKLLGSSVYVRWPHLTEARVIGISTPKTRLYRCSTGQNEIVSEMHSEDDTQEWHCFNNVLTDRYHDRWGVIIGPTEILVEAQELTGKKYVHMQGEHITLQKQWSTVPQMYAYQTVVQELDVLNTKQEALKNLHDLFPVKSTCFLLSSQYYGRRAEVISVDCSGPRASVELSVDVSEDPNLTAAINANNEIMRWYVPTYSAAKELGISPHLLSRIMGTFQVARIGAKSDRKVNIGLNLKFNMRSKEVVGYSRRIEKDWVFSREAVKAMQQYLEKFPEIFENINKHLSNRSFFKEEEIFPGDENSGRLDEVLEFLRTLPCYTAEQQACGAQILDADVVKVVEDAVDKMKGVARKNVVRQFSPREVFVPSDFRGISLPDSAVTFELFDRVINIKEGSVVPLGHKGTIIGIHPAEKDEDVTYDVVFDEEFPGGLAIRCAPNRGYRATPYSMMNVTHGLRKENGDLGAGGHKPTAIVRPQTNNHNSGGVPSVYGKAVRPGANSKGPKIQYGRGRTCLGRPAQVPTMVPRIAASGPPTIISPLALHTAMCPAPSNLAQDYHFRKFNHSPNSPFVPRQACPPAGAPGTQPQFITPKVFTNTQFQLQYRQPPPLLSVRQGAQSQESEFANLWMQLQMANTNASTVRNREDIKPPDKPMNVLMNPAKSHPRNAPRVAAMLNINPAVSCASVPCAGGSRQSSEFEKVLQALQNTSVSIQQPSSKVQVEKAVVSGQQFTSAAVAAASSSGSVREPSSPMTSSAALAKLLRTSETAKGDKKEDNVGVKMEPNYGRSISVEELFRDAKETERQRQAQVQVALGPAGHLDNSSCVSVLEHFVYSYSRELPSYDCVMLGPSHVGRVILPDKRTFTGSRMESMIAAKESAASFALMALGQPAPKIFPSNVRGMHSYADTVLAGTVVPPGPPAYQRIPNAAVSFQNVRLPSSVGNQTPQHAFGHRHPGPSMQRVAMPYSNLNTNVAGGAYGNRNPQGFRKPYQQPQQDVNRCGYADQSASQGWHQHQNQSYKSPNVSPQKPNAFVPLQVSRQQKSSSSKKLHKEPNVDTRKDTNQSSAHGSTQLNERKESDNLAGNINQGNVLSPVKISGQGKGIVNRRSSRLAVNFNNIQ